MTQSLREFFKQQTGRTSFIDGSGPLVNQMAEFADVMGAWLETVALAGALDLARTAAEENGKAIEGLANHAGQVAGEHDGKLAELRAMLLDVATTENHTRSAVGILLDILSEAHGAVVRDPEVTRARLADLLDHWRVQGTISDPDDAQWRAFSTEALAHALQRMGEAAKRGGLKVQMDASVTPRCEVCERVRAELRSTGHEFEGTTLDILVDRAIDRERGRREETIRLAREAAEAITAVVKMTAATRAGPTESQIRLAEAKIKQLENDAGLIWRWVG